MFPTPSQPVPVQTSDLLSACDVKLLVCGQRQEDGDAPLRNALAGLDVQRGHGVVTLEDGGQAELKTVSVETWHVQEFDDSEVPVKSNGQLHEGDSYVVRWTYSVDAAGR